MEFKFNSSALSKIVEEKQPLLQSTLMDLDAISNDIKETERFLKEYAGHISFIKFFKQETVDGQILEYGFSWNQQRIVYIERNVRYQPHVFSFEKNFGETKSEIRKKMSHFLPIFLKELIDQLN